jgi:hypothetical protein
VPRRDDEYFLLKKEFYMPDVITSQPEPAGASPVEMISAMLDAERVTPDAPNETPPATEAQPATDAEETGKPNAEVEGGEAEEAKGDMAEIPLDQLEAIELEISVQGEKRKVPIKELREGYMRKEDYTKKTQEASNQRAYAENVRQGIAAERAQYQNQLQTLEAAVLEAAAPELKNVDWTALSRDNPFEYTRLFQRQAEINQTLQAIRAKQQEATGKIAAEQRQAAAATAQKTWQALQSEIPGWNEQVYQDALKASESFGYTAAETAQWLDARAIKLLHTAREYQKLQASKPAAEKKVVNVPKVVKPGQVAVVSQGQQKKSEALQRLNKSGKVDDLANFLAGQM